MAELVGGFILPHAPMYLTLNDVCETDKKKACDVAFAETIDRLKALDVDTIVLIGDDHYTLFGPSCIPSTLICIGDIDGPVEEWMGGEFSRIENNEPLANHIMRHGHANDVDWAVAKALTVDHSIFVPWHYAIKPLENVRTIPVYLNSGVEPLIQNKRCQIIGKSIAAAIASWDKNERVAIIGTGGGAHWPATGDWYKLDAEWDKEILSLVEEGNVDALIAMDDPKVREEGGNGGWELKNWICMMAALGENIRGETYCYQDPVELAGAFAYVQMHTNS